MTKQKVAVVASATLLSIKLLAVPSVEVINVQQQYPWTNTVDITYTVAGVKDFPAKTATGEYASNETYFVTFEAKNGNNVLADVAGKTILTNALVEGNGTHVTQWQPALGQQVTDCTATPSVFRGEDYAYLIINLEANEQGRFDWWYEPLSTQETSNKRYNTEEYKTSKIVFRRIPAGTYTIGHDDWTKYRSANGMGNSAHEVTFPADYYFALFQLTFAQYNRIVDSASASTDKRSMYGHSWNEMRGSAAPTSTPGPGPMATLQELTGLPVDFPTHAMYEAAIRAGVRTYMMGATAQENGKYSGEGRNASVGTRAPNRLGLYDLLGPRHAWFIDGVPETSFTANEKTLANNFVPIATGTQRTLCDCMASDRSANYQTPSATWARIATTPFGDDQGFRLAVYPKGYYPNGGQK